MSFTNWSLEKIDAIQAEDFFELIKNNFDRLKSAFPVTLSHCVNIEKTQAFLVYNQGKEANKLGALTGPDYGILEKLVVDPTAFNQFLVDRSTINKLYNNERAFTSEIIKGTYETAQKAVPENLRPFVEVKPKELANKPESKDGKPKAPVSVQRGFLNGEPIEVRNKKWVYSKTGKAVE